MKVRRIFLQNVNMRRGQWMENGRKMTFFHMDFYNFKCVQSWHSFMSDHFKFFSQASKPFIWKFFNQFSISFFICWKVLWASKHWTWPIKDIFLQPSNWQVFRDQDLETLKVESIKYFWESAVKKTHLMIISTLYHILAIF